MNSAHQYEIALVSGRTICIRRESLENVSLITDKGGIVINWKVEKVRTIIPWTSVLRFDRRWW